MDRLRFVAFAAAYKRVGAILVEGNHVKEWKMSTNAAIDCTATKAFARKIINRWQPDVVVTEHIGQASTKGAQTRQVISVIASIAEDSPLLDVAIVRSQRFENKYKEAADMVKRHPVLASIRPVRRCFDREPRATVVFEALALIESVKHDPATHLANALG